MTSLLSCTYLSVSSFSLLQGNIKAYIAKPKAWIHKTCIDMPHFHTEDDISLDIYKIGCLMVCRETFHTPTSQ